MGDSENGSKVWDWSMGSLEVAPYKTVHPRSLRTRETHFMSSLFYFWQGPKTALFHQTQLHTKGTRVWILAYCVGWILLADKTIELKGLIRKRIFLSGQTWCHLVPGVGKATATVEGLCLWLTVTHFSKLLLVTWRTKKIRIPIN